MNNAFKILLGLITALPLLWVVLIFVALFAVPTESFLSDEPSGGRSFIDATMSYGIPLAVMVVLSVTSYFLFVIFKSSQPESRKVLWVLLLILWFPIAGPVFWYQHVWKRSETAR